jgi:hypothetical protein
MKDLLQATRKPFQASSIRDISVAISGESIPRIFGNIEVDGYSK